MTEHALYASACPLNRATDTHLGTHNLMPAAAALAVAVAVQVEREMATNTMRGGTHQGVDEHILVRKLAAVLHC